MADFVKIEWSGYWDFPSANYEDGEKLNQPITGTFPSDLIILDSVSGINYEIEPGKPTFPKSPEASFSLKNRNKSTGVEIYPYTKLSTMGRTAEYGGHSDKFADLFVRITSPILNDKVIFKGKVIGVSYSLYNNEVSINCTDFIGSLSNTDKQMFNSYRISNAQIEPGGSDDESQVQSDIINDYYGVSKTLKDYNGNDVQVERITARVSDVYYEDDISSRIDLWATTPSGLSSDTDFNLFVKESFSRYSGSNRLFKRIFFDNYEEPIFNKTYEVVEGTGGNFIGYIVNIETNPRYVFLQIGKDTILSRCKFKAKCHVVYLDPAFISTVINFKIKTIHMDNGNSEIKLPNDDRLVVYEKGRFLKKEDNPEEAEYLSDDTLPEYPDIANVTVYDWSFYPVEKDSFTIKDGWEKFSEDIVADFDTDIIITGFYFEDNSTNLVPRDNSGYFNNVESLISQLSDQLLSEFIFDPLYNNLFNTLKLDYSKHSHCYISDSIHYGWIGQPFGEAVVATGRQISAYLFVREDGNIIYQNRLHHEGVDIDSAPGFYQKQRDFFKPVAGPDYSLGDKFYKIEYADKIEINNLEGEEKIERVVNENGLASSFVSPQRLSVSNYRTSDLGVPDAITLEKIEEGDSDFNVLRKAFGAPNPEEIFFLQTPEDQAQSYALSSPYPSEILNVEVDVLKGASHGYIDASIGDYMVDQVDELETDTFTGLDKTVRKTKVYLISRINYNVNSLYSSGVQVGMTLTLVSNEEVAHGGLFTATPQINAVGGIV